MRLFHKIFLCFVFIFGILFQAAGILLLNYTYNNSIEQEKRYAFQQFQYNKYILRSIIYTDRYYIQGLKENKNDIQSDFNVPVALYDSAKNCLYSNMSAAPDSESFQETEEDSVLYQIKSGDNGSYIYVQDYIDENGSNIYFVTETDISMVVDKQNELKNYYQKIYMVIVGIGIPAIFLLSRMLTSSIQRVSEAADRIAGGNYEDRIDESGNDEIGELANNFNRMADKIEEKVVELSDAARQKEEFAANFAHELKTPMTSVIGYADMLYQKNLPREEVKSAAYYIWNEGMRLEALSRKLMELFVLDKQDFALEMVDSKELFGNMEESLESICARNDVKLDIAVEPALIKVEYDMLKTMFINVVDNAVKADSANVYIRGRIDEESGRYIIEVRDDGKGIPPEELGRITEAFYMVDKSRSRKQHGAGIGMALVSKIADIHNGELKIYSDGKNGTTVTIILDREVRTEDE